MGQNKNLRVVYKPLPENKVMGFAKKFRHWHLQLVGVLQLNPTSRLAIVVDGIPSDSDQR